MSQEIEEKDLFPCNYMSKGQVEAKIGKLLGTHKNAVFLGFSQNYGDFEVHYMDWRDNTKKSHVLREGLNDMVKNEKVPHWKYWKKELYELFQPIRKYMDKETAKHEAKKKGLTI